MGFYDGLGGVSDKASAWHLADTLGLPVLLVVEPKGQSLTLAAELRGLDGFRTPSHLAGILLNNCTARMHALLAPDAGRGNGPAGAGLPAQAPGGRHRFPPSGPLHGGRGGGPAKKAGPSGRSGGGADRLAPPAGPLRKRAARPVRCRRRRLRPASASLWRRTKRSASPTPRRWKPSGTPGQSWSFFSPLRDKACRKTSAGCICPAATRNFTPKH